MEDSDRPRRPAPPKPDRDTQRDLDSRPARPAHRPVPGVKHVPEPDAENIMPAEHEPGTL